MEVFSRLNSEHSNTLNILPWKLDSLTRSLDLSLIALLEIKGSRYGDMKSDTTSQVFKSRVLVTLPIIRQRAMYSALFMPYQHSIMYISLLSISKLVLNYLTEIRPVIV